MFSEIISNIVVSTLTDKETRDNLIKGSKNLISSIFDEDGVFSESFCKDNELSPRKIKMSLNECFDERDNLEEIAKFSEHYELGEHYFRDAIRAISFTSYHNGTIELSDDSIQFINTLAKTFLISKLEVRSLQREYKNEALEWWKDNQ